MRLLVKDGNAKAGAPHAPADGSPRGSAAAESAFKTDVAGLRAGAREHLDQGAVTPGYRGDREAVIRMLNAALATEIVCYLRYKRHYFMASGMNAKSAAADLRAMIREDLVAERIAIDSYGAMIRHLGADDPTTRRMLEAILASEEEHAEDLQSLRGGAS